MTERPEWLFRALLFAGALVVLDLGTQISMPLALPAGNPAAARMAMIQLLLENTTFLVMAYAAISVGLAGLGGDRGARWAGFLCLGLAATFVGAATLLFLNAQGGIFIRIPDPDAGTTGRLLMRSAAGAGTGALALALLGIGLLLSHRDRRQANS